MSNRPTPPSAPLMLSVSGLRGIVGRSLTPDVVCRYAAAVAGFLREHAGPGRCMVVVGRDGRAGGEAIARLATGALMAAGCDVVDCDVATTPTVGVMVRRLEAAGGLVVTASHNPGQWNGLKAITALGGAPTPDEMTRIIERYEKEDEAAPPWVASDALGRVRTERLAFDAHARRVLAALARIIDLETIKARRFRVVLDSVNASGAVAGRMLLEELGCAVVHLNNDDSGVFPHPPEPTAANLGELGEAMHRGAGGSSGAGADLGFAQDPDADRLAIVDNDGTYIGEEYTLALAAMSWLGAMSPDAAARQTLAANLSTSRMIDDVAAMFEARVVRTPVGEANVVAGMREAGATLGGEGNGGVVWMDVVPIRDSLSAMALTLALMARTGESLGALVHRIPTYAIEKRKIDLGAPGVGQVAEVDAPIAEALREAFPAAELTSADGVRLDFASPSGDGQAWIHVRASNTEPIIRLIAEAPTRADAAAILDTTESIVRSGVTG